MPKRLIKKITPDHDTVRGHRHLQIFGTLLHDPNLFHMNRRSISGAFAVGLFWAMIPIPLQMVAAAAIAIIVRVNLPLSIALVWITNPLTMPPIFYCNYLVGNFVFQAKTLSMDDFKMSAEWISHSFGEIWQPLFLGSLIVGTVLAAIGYTGMRLFWRWHVIHHYKKRHKADKPPSAS